MQGHYRADTNPDNVARSLERFASLGVEISITELDIQAGSDSVLSESLAREQGLLYASLFKLFKAHRKSIARVTIWGLDDGSSLRASSHPTLFDRDLRAKPAYYGAADPAGFIRNFKKTLKKSTTSP
jgi:endo-1,4-beta-xylanase